MLSLLATLASPQSPLFLLKRSAGVEEPTNDSKDSKDVWGEDDKQVDKSEQGEGDGDVTRPIESLVREHHLLDGSSHLSRDSKTP